MSSKFILVTGVNGYIGSHIALTLLQGGHRVRGASRSADAAAYLLSDALKGYESQYEHAAVPDMTAAHAFDTAVEGVDAIIHVASPINFSLTTLDQFLRPAVGGVTSILDSARLESRRPGSKLDSFVLTSSIAAVIDRTNGPDHIYDETDWNTSAQSLASANFETGTAYAASKTQAERAMWSWSATHNPTFALSAINPGLVFGPPVSWPSDPEQLNASLSRAWRIFARTTDTLMPAFGSGTVVDVRDVARLHVWCALHPDKARGQRYLALTGSMPAQAMADVMRRHYPDRDILLGNPGEGYVPDTYGFTRGGFVTDKMYAALGKDSVIPPDQMILDTVAAFDERWPDAIKNRKQQ